MFWTVLMLLIYFFLGCIATGFSKDGDNELAIVLLFFWPVCLVYLVVSSVFKVLKRFDV